jgi:hypothetical protein
MFSKDFFKIRKIIMSVEKMVTPEKALNIGYKLGELSRQIEMVIETANKSRSRERLHIEVFRVNEGLKFILDELKLSNTSETIQNDIEEYLKETINLNMDEKSGMILGKLKKKLADRKYRSNLKIDEVKELDLKLKIWRDKLTSELNALSSN